MATWALSATRRVALVVTTVLVIALVGPPSAARAAAGTITTTAQGARIAISLLGGILGPINLGLPDPKKTWTTNGSAATSNIAATPVNVPLTNTQLLNVGAITVTAAPVTGGGTASAATAGLNVLGSTLGADAISTSCTMTNTALTTTTSIANLMVAGAPVNPGVGGPVGVDGVLSGTIDKRTAVYDSTTGRLDYTVRALDLTLLSGLAVVAGGSVIVAESTCSGIVKLGAVSTTPAALVPGTAGTPKVVVSNTGDVAVPNTTIKIPVPPAGYTLGTPTVTGGGTCTTGGGFVTCTGVTVNGGSTATVSLPVSLAASGASAANWAPAANSITAVSTPLPGVATTLSIDGGGTLVTVLPPQSSGGAITVNPMSVAAGKAATTTLTVSNQGPSDATTTITVPIGNKPAGVSIVSATVAGNPCTVGASTITCTGVVVPGSGSTPISIRAAATTTTPPGTTWDLAGLTGTLNGTAITGSGRLLTVSDPDVNLDAGVSITPATAVPGGGAATATVTVRNIGIIPATGTTITLPAPPAGYTVGAVTTTGGGTCTTSGAITCTGVTVPANGTVTVSVPVTLTAAVTATWTAPAGDPVTATSGDSTGTATGTIITADPRWTLGVTSSGPASRTVRPGQTATMTVTVSDNGPSDARNATFVVVAPTGTTYGTLTGAAAACTQLSPTTLRCTEDIPKAGPAVVLTLPLAVSAQANPASPLADGCVSLNNDSDCADPEDVALASIQLRTPLADRLTVATTAATVVPGQDGFGKVGLTSTQAETGLTVTVPLGALPAGFVVASATVPGGGSCTVGASDVTCTGVDLTAATRKDISLRVTVASSVTPPATWTATGIVVDDGVEQRSVDGALAIAGTPAYALTATVTGPADNTVEPGQTTNVQVVATNNGPSDAPAATFTVFAPTGTTFGTPSPPVCMVANGGASAVCTTPLTAGAGITVDLPVVVPANAPVATPLTGGCVDLGHNGACGDPDDVTVAAILLKVPFSQQVTLSATPVTVTPGDTAVAKVSVNAVHGDQTGLTLTIPLGALPAGLTVTAATSAAATCAVNGGQVDCTALRVEDGQTTDVELTVRAAASSAANLTWTATGISVSNGVDPPETASKLLATTGPPSYVLDAAVTVPAPGTVAPGQTATVDVQVDDLGPSDAVAAPFGVIAPAGTTFAPLAGTALADCVLDAGDQRASCVVTLTAAAAPRAYSFGVVVPANAPAAVAVAGGCVDLDNDSACLVPPDEAIGDIWLYTPLNQRLTVTTGPVTVVPGEDGPGEVVLQSSRPESNLTVVIPTTALPAGFTAPSATVPGGGSCTAGANALTCTGVDLTANTPKSIAVRVVLASSAAAATWTATGIDVADGTDHQFGTGAIATTGTPRSGVTATVTGPADGTVSAGDTTTLTVVATNAGPSDVTGRVFTVSAPASSTFGTLTGAAATVCSGSNTTLITCTVSLTATADTGALVLPLVIDANADPFVPLTGACADLNGTAGCGTGDTAVDPITLKVPFNLRARIDTAPATVTPGTEDTATVGVQALHGALSNVTLTVPLGAVPPEFTVTTAEPGCTIAGGQFECTGVTVADQATTTFTLRVRATPAAAPGVTWTATGITAAIGAETVSADRPLAVTGAPVHPLDATVTAPAQPILPGGTGTLGIAVDNLGPSDVSQATIGVNAPTNSTFGALTGPTATICSPDPAATRLACVFDLTAAAPALQLSVPLVVGAGASAASPPTGGCVDLNDNGTCEAPPDRPMPAIPVATPFADQIAVSTTTATVAAGENGIGRIVVTTDRPQTGLTVVVPLAGKPADVFVGGPSVTPSGTCTSNATEIRCTGVDITAGNPATVAIPLAVTPSAAANLTWTVAGVTVTDAGGDTATGGGVLLQTGTADFRLTATTAGPAAGTVLPGGTGTITLTLDNTGPSDATGAPVTVQAPVTTTFGPLTGAVARSCTANPAGTTLTCSVTLAATDEPLVWTLPIVVPGTADPQVALTGGCADLSGDGACGGAGDIVLPDIQLRTPLGTVLTVTADNPTLTPGATGTATVRVAASQTRTGLTVRIDTAGVPTGLSVTGAALTGANCTIGATVECTGVDIPANDRADIALTLAARPDAPQGTWNPAVTVTGGGETVDATPLTATVGAPVHPLTVTVGVPASGTVLPGGTADLAVTVANGGPSRYPAAPVRFKAPTGTTFGVPADPDCTLTSPDVVDCTLDLAVETRPLTLRVLVPAGADPAVVLGGGCYDADRDGACTGAPDQAITGIQLATPLADDARLSVELGTVVPGGSAGTGYVVVDADRSLTGLTVTVPRTGLPAGFTVDGASGPAGSTCTLTPAIVCTGVQVSTGQRRVIAVTVRAGSGLGSGVTWTAGPITLTNAGGESAQAVTAALVSTGTPVASVTYTTVAPAAGTVEPGQTATFTVTVANAGPSDATGRTTSILAPPGATFGPLTGQAQSNCTAVVGDARLNCTFGLAANASPLVWSIPLVVPGNTDPAVVFSGGCLDTAGDGTCAGDDPLPGVTLRRTLGQALTVSADNPTLTPGRTGTATVTVAAADARTGLDVTIPTGGLPAGLTATAALAAGTPCTVGASAITCTGMSIAANASTAIAVSLTAAPNAAGGPVWAPAISLAQAGATTVTRTLTVATVGAPSTAVTVAVVPPATGTVRPGGAANLAVTVSNAGPSHALAYRVGFQAPTGTTFVAPAVNFCTLSSTTVAVCTVDVNAGADLPFTLTVAVPANADPATPVGGGCVDGAGNGNCTAAIPAFTLGTPLTGLVQLSTAQDTVTPGLTGTALVRATATGALTGVTVTVPFTGLPTGLTVTGAAGPTGATCALGTAQVVCTGVDLAGGANTAVRLTVRAAANLAAGVTWTGTGITLARGAETVTGGGTLAVTGSPISAVAVAVAGPGGTVRPGATTAMTVTITNPGPSDATAVTATVVAPGNTVFGALSGPAATDCARTSSTLLTCTFNQAANAAARVWVVPLIVSSTAATGDTVSGGCVSLNGGTSCGDSVDIDVPEFNTGRPLSETTTVRLGPATIAAGATGTAKVIVTPTADNAGLTLTVPLTSAVPTGVTVTGATIGDATCTVGSGSIVCSDVSLTAGTPAVLSIAVAVAGTVTTAATWQVTGVTLVNDADSTDRLTASGLLVTTTATAAAVTVSVGTPSVPSPAPGQTTVLPVTFSNAGPGDADPYTTGFVLPPGTSHGALPAGCTEGSTDRIVTCTLALAAGESAELDIPVVLDADNTVGSTISGGCVDADNDGLCGGDQDTDLPAMTVSAPTVDLTIDYSNPKPTVVKGRPILLKLPYSNNGSQNASDVTFTVDPPAGVTVTRAAVLLDSSAAEVSVAAAELIDAVCEPAPDIDANAVRCVGPDAPIGASSELWLYLAAARAAKAGTYPISVMISTTSAEGDKVNNTAVAQLTIAGADGDNTDDGDDTDGGNGGNGGSGDNGSGTTGNGLPKTGQDLTGLLLLSVLLVFGGVAARIMGRNRRLR